MNDHGIMFTGAMVRALLAGRKDVTRRTSDVWARRKPGDRLWVKETWRTIRFGDEMSPSFLGEEWGAIYGSGPATPNVPVWYIADGTKVHTDCIDELGGGWSDKMRPAVHMPRWASRTLLEVVSVTREPGIGEDGRELPAVTDNEAIREGIYLGSRGWTWDESDPTIPELIHTPRLAYLALFRTINPGPMPDHLWRIEFRRVETR